jgi:predicted DNA-binding ribbon-helix-helix protein
MTQANRSGSTQPGAQQQTGAIVKRSVVIAGHQTSVSLEHAFWTALKAAAARRGITINDLVTRIDAQRQGNLSSAIRVFLLEDSLRAAAATASTAA